MHFNTFVLYPRKCSNCNYVTHLLFQKQHFSTLDQNEVIREDKGTKENMVHRNRK
jgi:hypothetical protein